jgi:ribonuclease P protein component
LREALRARLEQLQPGLDVLVIARPTAARATWAELNVALDRLLDKAGATAAVGASV